MDVDVPIGALAQAGHPLRPLAKLEPGPIPLLSKARVFPFLRVLEPIAVEVQDVKATLRRMGQVGFEDGVSGALDGAGHAKPTQEVANKGGFARPQVASEHDATRRDAGCLRQGCCHRLGVGLGAPMGRSYNRAIGRRVVSFKGQGHGEDRWAQLQSWGKALGFSQIAVAPVDLSHAEEGLASWLAQGFAGEMDYMARHGLKRARPAELVPGTLSVVTARMNYLPRHAPQDWAQRELDRLNEPGQAVVSVYARGRNYHKVLRQRLNQLADRMRAEWGPLGHRVFTDSAPVMEVELGVLSGQGWRGKHSLLLSRQGGSMFFLGEIFVDMALPTTPAVSAHCGSCNACREACPTQAIVADGVVDARRCISYLTIEHAGDIPMALRESVGSRLYGCDDCQLVCPWNAFAQASSLSDFDARPIWGQTDLLSLWSWTEADFLRHTEGSAIRRIGFERWQRNLAVVSGNALRGHPQASWRPELVQALRQARRSASDLVGRHIDWALGEA